MQAFKYPEMLKMIKAGRPSPEKLIERNDFIRRIRSDPARNEPVQEQWNNGHKLVYVEKQAHV